MKLSRGFTLIETIFAIAILVIGIAGVLMMFATGTKSQYLSKMGTGAVFLAQARLEEVVSKSYLDINSGVEDYGEILGFENYKREVEAVFWDPINSVPSPTDIGIKRVKVIVFWDSDQKNPLFTHSAQLTTFISKK